MLPFRLCINSLISSSLSSSCEIIPVAFSGNVSFSLCLLKDAVRNSFSLCLLPYSDCNSTKTENTHSNTCLMSYFSLLWIPLSETFQYLLLTIVHTQTLHIQESTRQYITCVIKSLLLLSVTLDTSTIFVLSVSPLLSNISSGFCSSFPIAYRKKTQLL